MTIDSNDVKEWVSIICGIGVILLMICAFIFIGYDEGKIRTTKNFQVEAITNGAAYWSVNPTNGVTTFTWGKQ